MWKTVGISGKTEKSLPFLKKQGHFPGTPRKMALFPFPHPSPARPGFFHNPFTKCGEISGANREKTGIPQRKTVNKGTKTPINFQNFPKWPSCPQKNSTTHEKPVEKTPIHAISQIHPVQLNGTTPYGQVGAATCRPPRGKNNLCG